MLLLLSIIQFLSHGQPHQFVSICTIFQWFTHYESDSLKMVMVSDLCLICVILLLYWFIYYGLGSRTTTNDSCLIHTIFDQNDGQIVGSPLMLWLLKAFSKIFPMGGWGGPEKDQKLL